MKTKIQSRDRRQARYPYYGLGFKVDLLDVPLMEIDGEWVPDVNFNAIEDIVGHLVALKPAPLTGAEVRFLRRHVGLTLDELAAHLGVTRQGAIKWEKCGERPTRMGLATDKLLRLIVLELKGVSAGLFKKAFNVLQQNQSHKNHEYAVPAYRLRSTNRFGERVMKN